MSGTKGVTLMEMVIVSMIVGIAAAVTFVNYNSPMQQAKANTALNNLLAIYAAQQNYSNNNGKYCTTTVSASTCDDLADINTDLSLIIQDDGSYAYSCSITAGTPLCQATSSLSVNPIKIYLNSAVQYPLTNNVNPTSADCPGSKCPL